MSVCGGHTCPYLGDSGVDIRDRLQPVATLVGLGGVELGPCLLEKTLGGLHMRLIGESKTSAKSRGGEQARGNHANDTRTSDEFEHVGVSLLRNAAIATASRRRCGS